MITDGPKTYEDVLKAIDSYKVKFRRPELPDLEFSKLLALFPEDYGLNGATLTWIDPWPNGERQGVYFVFGQALKLLYIGKASMRRGIGSRLAQWFQFAPDRGCKVVHPGWSEMPRFIATLAVPVGMGFEAPAIEEYLITQLLPPDNGVGVG